MFFCPQWTSRVIFLLVFDEVEVYQIINKFIITIFEPLWNFLAIFDETFHVEVKTFLRLFL